MTTFADIVAAVRGLSSDEQQNLITILQRQIGEENRARLQSEIAAARAEHASGASQPTSVADLMDDIRRDAGARPN